MKIENPEKRMAVASQIKEAKKRDTVGGSEHQWKNYRGYNSYESYLGGFSGMFEYIKTLPSHKVIDIGAGHTVAFGQLSRGAKDQGLTFEAVTLSGSLRRQSYFKNDIKIHINSAENMRSISSNEYGGVISVYSICYSEAPDVVVDNIDRILVPGGVFKGSFAPDEKGLDVPGAKTPHLFNEYFIKKGYDTAINEGVLLAIKPGPNICTATELMKKDTDNEEKKKAAKQAASELADKRWAKRKRNR